MRWGLVWLALAAIACGPPPGREAEACASRDQIVVIEMPATPPLELRIESCRIDADACPSLCAFVSDAEGLEPSFHDACEVTFRSDEIEISYSYSEWGNSEWRQPCE